MKTFFWHFFLGWIKIETGDAHKHLVNIVFFHENWLGESQTSLRTINLYLPHLLSNFGKILSDGSEYNAMDNHEFNEKGHRKGHTFIMSVSDLHLHVYHHLLHHY
jgi:hypothetical protein